MNEKNNIGRKLRVINCEAFGKEIEHLTPGSVHEIVKPPHGQNNQKGEWVMGKTEPVLVLHREFSYI